MGALAQLASRDLPARSERSFSLDEYIQLVMSGIGSFGLRQTLTGKEERGLDSSLQSLVQWALKRDGVVFAAIALRAALFSGIRFQFIRYTDGEPGDPFGTTELGALERPSNGRVLGDLLTEASVFADLAGEAFLLRTGDEITVQRSDWISMGIGSKSQPDDPLWAYDAKVLGYGYHPGGYAMSPTPITTWLAGPVGDPENRIAHFRPFPDPATRFRGMSPLIPVMAEIEADRGMTDHKLAFLRNGATPNAVVTLNSPLITDPDSFRAWIDLFEEEHKGAANAYKNLYVLGGTDMKVVGETMRQMDFRNVQGAGELRLASALQVPPVLLGLLEATQGAALNQGNFSAARRLFADFTMRPRWANFAASMETIVPPPPGAELWPDDRHVPALAEDQKDRAAIQVQNATAITLLHREGWDPDASVNAVMSGNLRRLIGEHSGLPSVQLQQGPSAAPPELPAGPPPPPQLPAGRSMPLLGDGSGEVRCWSCHRLLAERASAPYRFTCTNPKCKTVNEVLDETRSQPPLQIIRVEAAPTQQVDIAAILEAARSQAPDFGPVIEAIRALAPEAPSVTFEAGAFHTEVHAPEPAQVTIEEGAVHVENHPAAFEEGAIHVEVHAPEPAQVNIEQGAMQVTVEPSPVTIEKGAVQVDVHAPEPAQVTIAEGAVHVEVQAPEAPSVTFEAGAITTPEVTVNVPAAEPANVTIEEGAVRVEVQAAPAPSVTIEEGAISAPNVNVTVEKDIPMRTVIDRDPETGLVVGDHEERI